MSNDDKYYFDKKAAEAMDNDVKDTAVMMYISDKVTSIYESIINN